MSTLFGDEMMAASQSLSNEWYTLAKYIDAARTVMDGIELDPATCEMANQTVRATRYYTQKQNGLAQDWSCCSMWLNPPFGTSANGRSNMAVWTQRLIEEYEHGNVEQAILLCMSNTEALWFSPLWNYPICFPCPRVMFYRPNGSLDHHVLGTCFVYFGPNEAKFIDVFSQFGTIAKRVSTPKQAQVVQHDLWSNGSEVA
jgi:ParB family chromosome partitioning protein